MNLKTVISFVLTLIFIIFTLMDSVAFPALFAEWFIILFLVNHQLAGRLIFIVCMSILYVKVLSVFFFYPVGCPKSNVFYICIHIDSILFKILQKFLLREHFEV